MLYMVKDQRVLVATKFGIVSTILDADSIFWQVRPCVCQNRVALVKLAPISVVYGNMGFQGLWCGGSQVHDFNMQHFDITP